MVVASDGGLITTATDLLRLITAVDGYASRPDILNSTTFTKFLTPPTGINSSYACGIDQWAAENLYYNYGSLPGTRTGFFMTQDNGMCIALLFNSRQDNDTFTYAMQDLMLDIVKNGSYSWQDIDQF